MRDQKFAAVIITFVLAVSVISSSITALLITKYYRHVEFQRLGNIMQAVIDKQPEARQTILEAMKAYKEMEWTDQNILLVFGFQEDFFSKSTERYSLFFAGIGLMLGMSLFLAAFWFWHRKEALRVRALTACLEKVNTGGQGVLLSVSEDEFSKLQDEIYKTVTTLYQTRDAAVDARINYAENLSNIAHQLKTPITAISLSAQMMQEKSSLEYSAQIQKQLKRLIHLEEALLLLSRIDAGTLALKREPVDVFTVITLAADNLQDLFMQEGVYADIPEMEEMEITVDMDWTMEALMNLLKNCMEHSPKGKTVHCSCEQNLLYTEIQIWDEGAGFHKEDIPHLFERFYRGQNVKENGIGIGLSITKAIIEMQNGVISAGNIPNGGAYFEIRIYSH